LGVSEHAVRQRIRRNTLASEKTAAGRVYVLLDLDALVSGEPSEDTSGEASGVDPVQMLREHNQMLREQLAEAHAANRENRRIIAGLIQRVPELEPPRDERDARETVSETSEGTDTPTDRETGVQRRSSWWRRFFGFE
jgi:hypothetical protein